VGELGRGGVVGWFEEFGLVMEKLKSWNALSNFFTATAAAGIYVFEN
jgi:hypothetical protein